MKTSREYIKSNLERLSVEFPITCFKYGFDDIIQSHVIEITPQDHFYGLKELDQAWIPISLEFMELYPKEDLVFISSDSSLSLKVWDSCYNENAESIVLSDFYDKFLNQPVREFGFVETLIVENEDDNNSYLSNQGNILSASFETISIGYDFDQLTMAA